MEVRYFGRARGGQDRQSDTAEIEVGFVKTELAVGLDDWPIGGMIHGANRGGPPGARLC